MTTLKDKLTNSVRQARDTQTPATTKSAAGKRPAAAAKPAAKAAAAPASKPASAPTQKTNADDMHADPQPSAAVLFPGRVWPD